MSRPRLLSALISIWLLVVLASYHFLVEPFPAWHVLSVLGHVMLLGLVTASAWGWGSLALRPLGLDAGSAPRILIVMIEIATGLGALALGVFALAAAGLLYRPAALVLVVAGVAALAAQQARRGGGWSVASAPPWSRVELALVALLALAAVLTLTAAVAPPEFYDALIYHLEVPDHYIRHHGMVPIEGNYYAHYPANMGMLYALALLLRDAPFAQSLHWLCGVLSVFTLYAIGVRHAGRTEALMACVLFGLIPGVMLVSTAAIADLTITLFATAGFAAVLEWRESGGTRWLVVAGIMAGLAMGTKYTAALVVCLPCAAALAACRGRSWAERGRAIVLVGAVALVLLSPWLVRNVLYAGNPVAPYLSSSAGSGDALDLMGDLLPKGMAGVTGHVLASPWNASMKSLGYAGQLGPVFLILLPALPFLGRLPSVAAPAALMACVGFAAWALTMPLTRYVMPVLPLVALLAALAARRLPRPLAAVAVGWPVVYGLYLYCFLILTIGSWGPVTGAETEQEYLSRRVTYYPAAAFMESLPADARVLFVGEGRGFYVPRSYEAASMWDPPPLDGYAARAPQGEAALVALLRHEGFTHLLVSGPELRRTRKVSAEEVMSRFFPGGLPRLVFERNDVRLYALPGRPAS